MTAPEVIDIAWWLGVASVAIYASIGVSSRWWPRTRARLTHASIGSTGYKWHPSLIIAYSYEIDGATHYGTRLMFGGLTFPSEEAAKSMLEELERNPLEVSVCPGFPSLATALPGVSFWFVVGMALFFSLTRAWMD